MAETWTLNPSATPLILTSSSTGITVKDPGFQIQTGQIKGTAADTIDGEGAPSLSQQYENWVISGTLQCQDYTGGSVEAALHKLGRASDRALREGAELKRVISASQGGSTLYFDVERFSLGEMPAGQQFTNQSYAEVPVEIITKPLARMAESTLADNTETTLPALVFVSTSIAGQAPALGRLVIDNDSTAFDQRFVCGGIQSRTYSTADTAALYYQAEHLKPLGSAATSASTSLWSEGSFTGGFVKSTNLGPTWAGVLETMVSTQALASTSTAHMTHVGSYRVWTRVFQPSANSTGVQLRLDWSPGDAAEMTENDPYTVTVKNDASLVDLGPIHIPEALVGAQRWVGRVQAKSAVTGDDIYVDDLRVVPVDEGYFEVRTPLTVDTPTSFSARSEFTTESGVITGDSLVVGGTWTGAGDADDFSASSNTAVRTAVSDAAGIESGRLVTASTPTTLTNTGVTVKFKQSVPTAQASQGVLLRYTNTSNFCAVYFSPNSGATAYSISVAVRAGGATTTPAATISEPVAADKFYTMAVMCSAAGALSVFIDGRLRFQTHSLTLATGGTLASGTVGIVDYQSTATANTRTYDNFAAWVPADVAAIQAAQSMQWRYDGALREDSAGAVWVPAPLDGDPALPPASGREARKMRTIVFQSRGDPRSGEADTGIDDISARWRVQPRLVTVPG